MKRNMIVPVRFTEEEYLLIKKMIEEEAMKEEIEKEVEILSQLQEEIKKENGGNGS